MTIIDYPALIASLTTLAEKEKLLEAARAVASSARTDVSGTGYKLTIARLKAETAEQTVTDLEAEIATMRAALPAAADIPLAWSCQFLAEKQAECRRLETELEEATRELEVATEENKKGAWKRAGARKDSAEMVLAKNAMEGALASLLEVKKAMDPIQKLVDDMIAYDKENAAAIAWCEGTGPAPAEYHEAEAEWWESVFEESVAFPLRTKRLVVFV